MSCAAAERFVVETAFPSDVVGKETMIFGLLQDVGDSVCQAGQEMCCLLFPSLHSCSAAPGWL